MSQHYPASPPAQHQEHQPGQQHHMHPEPEIIKPQHRGSQQLQNKVAIISGGDSGIGRSIAVLFAREGADIAIVYLDEDQDAQDTQKLVAAEGRTCLTLKANLADPQQAHSVVSQTLQKFGKVNILINNAAVQYPQANLEDISPEQLQHTFQSNLFSMYYLTQSVLPHLHTGDSIINTSSITSYRGHEQLIDYASSKGAITSFTRSLASHLLKQSRGIRVNAVAPGPIWTPLIPSSFDAQTVADFGKDSPMGRMGQPSEVAPAYLFLASDAASYIAGQVIHVNGGEILNT